MKLLKGCKLKVVIPEKSRYEGKPIRNEAMSSELYSNMLLVARKKSGKTNIIFNYVRKSVGANTKVYVFASTWYRDATYKELRRYLEKKNIFVQGFTSLMEGRQNLLKQILDEASKEEEKEDAEEEQQEEQKEDDWKERCLSSIFSTQKEEQKEEKKVKKEKYVSPEMIIVLDDLHSEMKSSVISGLVTRNRHYKCKVIMSTQYTNMVPPQVWSNLDIVLLGHSLPMEKLELIHNRLDLTTPEEEFMDLYKKATSKPFSFLYIDVNKEQFRRNFNMILK